MNSPNNKKNTKKTIKYNDTIITDNSYKLVIVESPKKIKVLEGILKKRKDGPYKVIASCGHIKTLAAKGKGVTINNKVILSWENTPRADKNIQTIIDEASKSNLVILATDCDREGEAIAFHISNMLENKQIKTLQSRVTFQSLTENAINDAFNNMKQLNNNLIEAYLARSALDYLIGFKLSPILWVKVPGCISAGRVQSAALKGIIDKEWSIVNFKKQQYWLLFAQFSQNQNIGNFEIYEFENKSFDKMLWSGKSQNQINELINNLKNNTYKVTSIETKKIETKPYPAFITSTMQQEASSKLGWQPAQTASVAQKLYEGMQIGKEIVGLITYMRTDSIIMSDTAIQECIKIIKTNYGDQYLPSKPIIYQSKTKNAQEAHEAIRPTHFHYTPEYLKQYLQDDALTLYTLIWKRAVASQMNNAIYEIKNVFIASYDNQVIWKGHGTKLIFDGFKKLYLSETEDNILNYSLWELNKADSVLCDNITSEDKETQAPGRFSQAGLIKHMEEVGIGRPSTYHTIAATLEKRNYITTANKKITPTQLGWIVISFLDEYFKQYVDQKFTAQMEELLDKVANNETNWEQLVLNFWSELEKYIETTHTLKNQTILSMISDKYSEYWFGKEKKCSICNNGNKKVNLFKGNVFIGCSNYPQCKGEGNNNNIESSNHRILGSDENGNIIIKKGIYGSYAQWDNTNKRLNIPAMFNPDTVTLEEIKKLQSLPRSIGIHPYSQQEIQANIGRFGPYILHEKLFISVKNKNIFDITLDDALELLNAKQKINKKKK